MQEISDNKVGLIVQKTVLQDKLKRTQRYLICAGIIAYTFLVVAVLAIINANKQQVVIDNQAQTIMYLTSQLVDSELSMQEMRSDYAMLDELGK